MDTQRTDDDDDGADNKQRTVNDDDAAGDRILYKTYTNRIVWPQRRRSTPFTCLEFTCFKLYPVGFFESHLCNAFLYVLIM